MKRLLFIPLLLLALSVGAQSILRVSSFYTAPVIEEAPPGGTDFTVDLLAYYTFDEAAGVLVDQIGAIDGTVQSSVERSAAGKIDDAFGFEYGEVDSVGFGLNNFQFADSFTISFWYNRASHGYAYSNDLMENYSDAIFRGWELTIINDASTSKVRFKIDANAGTGTITGSTDIYNTGFHMITITYDRVHLQLYLDGVSDAAEVDYTAAQTYGSAYTHIKDAHGDMDELYIWDDKALTAAQVLEFFNLQDAGTHYPF